GAAEDLLDDRGPGAGARLRLQHDGAAPAPRRGPAARGLGLLRHGAASVHLAQRAVLLDRERTPAGRGERGLAREVLLLAAAPDGDVAVERDDRVQVMHEVVVLVEQQRREDALRPDAVAGGLE